jgi:hypothetical protein
MPTITLPALAMGPMPEGYGTGLEWMILASVAVPVVVLILVAWYGSRNDV